MDYERELNILKDNLERAKSLKYRAEARLEQLKKTRGRYNRGELKELNVKPEELEEEIQKLTNEINVLFKEANELLPKDLLEKK